MFMMVEIMGDGGDGGYGSGGYGGDGGGGTGGGGQEDMAHIRAFFE